jgi:hypothetical protein
MKEQKKGPTGDRTQVAGIRIRSDTTTLWNRRFSPVDQVLRLYRLDEISRLVDFRTSPTSTTKGYEPSQVIPARARLYRTYLKVLDGLQIVALAVAKSLSFHLGHEPVVAARTPQSCSIAQAPHMSASDATYLAHFLPWASNYIRFEPVQANPTQSFCRRLMLR